MAEFDLDDRSRSWVERAQQFGEEWIKPASVREWEPDPARRVSWDVIEAGSRAGFRTCGVPPEHGGPDPELTPLTLALIVEAFAAADPGIANYFNHAIKDVRQVARLGTDEQKERFFRDFLTDERYLTAHASCEPEHGSDRYLPPDGFRFDTTAVRNGDEWVLNGRKYCISAGNEARLVLVQATTNSVAEFREATTMFMVYRENPGLRQGAVHDKAGLRLVNNSEVILEDCRVPDRDVLGRVNHAVTERRGQANDNGMLSIAMKLGIARRAFENALEYARQRVQGGRPIIEHQAVGLKLAEAAAHVETIRSSLFRFAWMNATPGAFDQKFSELTTWLTAELAFKVATLAVQICGCQGVWLDNEAQKHVRDAMMYFPNDGTHTIHLLNAHQLLIADD